MVIGYCPILFTTVYIVACKFERIFEQHSVLCISLHVGELLGPSRTLGWDGLTFPVWPLPSGWAISMGLIAL